MINSKNDMKKLNLSILLLALPLIASAYDCQVNGIYYNLIPKGNLAEVTYKDNNYNSYSNVVNLPEKFTYEGVEYSVGSIGEYAFYGCRSLNSVNIPSSVTNIGIFAFSECNELTAVTIPNSVTTIGGYAFKGCRGLATIILPKSITSIELNTFEGCSSLKSVTIPNSVTTLGYNVFYKCEGLTSVTIPNSVIDISGGVFYGCIGLTSVTIGSSVRSIGSSAFASCSKLEKVYCYAEKIPYTSTDAFDNSYPEYMTLYVPSESVNEYKATDPWSFFGTIKSINESGEQPQKCATPIIGYGGKRLFFSCDTEGVEYVYEIKDTDIKKGYDAMVNLSATYEISVFATKAGYENSNIATATLVWASGMFTETTPSSAKAIAESIPLLISAQNGTIAVRGEQNGLPVTVYSADGKMLGSATIKDGQASIATNLQRGEIAIMKVGKRSVKIKAHL